jgi:hypothetical protein
VQEKIGRILWKASEDERFRQRLRDNLGATLAEEGFILSDTEMSAMRTYWEGWQGLSDRAAYERITAAARSYRRNG